MEDKTELTAKNLKKRGFVPHIADKAEVNGLVSKIIGDIPCVIGSGGSMTLKELKTLFRLQDAGHKVYSYDTVSDEERDTMYQRAAQADWYVSSANAVTTSGDIVNIDGTANRVAPLIFGVPNVVYVIGSNKIVSDLAEAEDRIRNYTCHLNAVRLGKKTPCAVTGKCSYCNSPDCMCNVTTVVHHPTRLQKQVHVIFVRDALGY